MLAHPARDLAGRAVHGLDLHALLVNLQNPPHLSPRNKHGTRLSKSNHEAFIKSSYPFPVYRVINTVGLFIGNHRKIFVAVPARFSHHFDEWFRVFAFNFQQPLLLQQLNHLDELFERQVSIRKCLFYDSQRKFSGLSSVQGHETELVCKNVQRLVISVQRFNRVVFRSTRYHPRLHDVVRVRRDDGALRSLADSVSRPSHALKQSRHFAGRIILYDVLDVSYVDAQFHRRGTDQTSFLAGFEFVFCLNACLSR